MGAAELEGAAVLDGLAAGGRRAVLAAAVGRTLAGGAALFRQGEPAQSLHVVASGRVRLTQAGPAGEEIVVRVCGPGEVFAGIAVIDGGEYPFTAVATVPSRVVSWPRPVLLSLLEAHPRFRSNVLGIVGAHAREALERLREVATEPVPQRLARALLRLARTPPPGGEVIVPVTQRELADMAGTTLYTVNRTLGEWAAAGIARPDRGRVIVTDPERLRRAAGSTSDR